MLEAQNQQMRALIETLKAPHVPNTTISLPEFDPDKSDADAKSWCATADLCFAGNPPEGSELILTVTRAMKGTAAAWFSRITYPGITWEQLKELFAERFVTTETIAGTLIDLAYNRPQEKETYAAYANRIISALMTQWKDVEKEEIIIAIVLSHLSKLDTKLQRIAFTSQINTRQRLHQELQAFSYLKRRSDCIFEENKNIENKRTRFSQSNQIKCHYCGKMGHKLADCRLKTKHINLKASTSTSTAKQEEQQQHTASGSIRCYKCGVAGHIAARCATGAARSGGSGVVGAQRSAGQLERRIDECAVESPSAKLCHQERDFPDDGDDEADLLLSALPENTPRIPFKPAQKTDDEILQRSREYYDLMAQRRTVRCFSTEPIPDEVLDNIIKTAGTSPSGAHTEPWTFVVVQDPDIKEAIRTIVEEEEEMNYAKRMSRQWVTDLKPFATNHVKPYLSDAPALLLVFRQTYSWRPDGKKKMHYYSEVSVAIAAGILLAAIQYCGLVALTSTPLNCNARLRDLLSRPANERLELLLPVGKPHKDTTVPDLQRKTLNEIMVKI